MSVGESIKSHRIKSGLTQKELADQLNVSFQTVSKWENDTNEPDLNTLKALSNIFKCSIDELINDVTEEDSNKSTEENINENHEETKILLATCKDCGKPIYSGDPIHHMVRKTGYDLKENVDICEDCYKKHEELAKQLNEINHPVTPKKVSKGPFKKFDNRPDGKLIGWSIIAGVVVFGVLLAILLCNQVNIAASILLPIVAGYAIFTDIYCVFSDTWISELFIDVASWSIRFPGIIFTFDLDGLKFLIFMKILFFLLGIFVTIGVFALAIIISALFAMFCFPYFAYHNKKGY